MRNTNAKWAMRMVARVGIFYALLVAAVATLQRSLLYFPSNTESTSRLTAWADQGEIVGYCREVSRPKTVWLMMHGNAGQASGRDYVLKHLSKDDSLYVLEYPGYGARKGTPSKISIDVAAIEAYEILKRKHPNVPIGVIGESLGSGPASMLAKVSIPPEKIVLITPFDTLCNVASNRFWFLPVRLLLLDRWDNMESLRHYAGQVEIFGAISDSVIPIGHARNLAQSVATSRLIEIPGGHNDWSFCDEVKIER